MKKVAVVTSTRAEYGILTPLIRAIEKDSDIELELIVTGTHLSKKYGYTVSFIEEDGFPISHKIPIMTEGNLPCDISETMANALKGFAHCFVNDPPDMLVILGDRTEMLSVAAAAMNEHIPIAHIHGGEVTQGAVDDCIRHSLTKMSFLHFTSTEIYRKRVIQLGESPSRVFNVGALGAENILHESLMAESEIKNILEIPASMNYAVVTYHPVTLETFMAEKQTKELCMAMHQEHELFYLITMANADSGGDDVNRILSEYAKKHIKNTKLVSNLGMKKYLSAVKYASFMLGNSSSGIIEAPVLGTPTVNIGDRQKGRFMAETVITCEPTHESIVYAINAARARKHKPMYIYGDGKTSQKIVEIIKRYLFEKEISLKKNFYDCGVIV
ncbi:UDP-N-acetylglucosamine 2-epimerase [Parablautia muri]|uniref:UDP-N-acetylglucosamine 2-epimerase (Hydrolyzing) n=1 Tax=Parablautia muri TaxID=2320879 RepID=A0A9X5BEY8_9FIRM|nr:UDP-N-acetylglucosamine 2-epimerase [Parablautia muri]NBJ92525.1 UDP-N-acetylglucosamine 2-epimerase (hydrolyzing) [Parablautia muri]